MVIVVEGPDGAGKTTLVKALSKRLASQGIDFASSHHGPYKDIEKSGDLARQYFLSMTRSLSYNNVSILDRSWISEPIYSEVYRGTPSRLTNAHVRMLERAALSRGMIQILCRPSYQTCLKVFGERDEYIDKDNLHDVFVRYDELVDGSDIVYNRDVEDVDQVVERILNRIDATPANIFNGGGNYVDPSVLVLCGKWTINNIRPDAVIIPYFGLHNGPSPSVLLADAFEELGIPESQMYWVNTQTNEGDILTSDIMEFYHPDLVVAIGPIPEQWAKSNGIDCVVIPQPKTGSKINMENLHELILYPQAGGVSETLPNA
jgi:thymidylate kinase